MVKEPKRTARLRYAGLAMNPCFDEREQDLIKLHQSATDSVTCFPPRRSLQISARIHFISLLGCQFMVTLSPEPSATNQNSLLMALRQLQRLYDVFGHGLASFLSSASIDERRHDALESWYWDLMNSDPVYKVASNRRVYWV